MRNVAWSLVILSGLGLGGSLSATVWDGSHLAQSWTPPGVQGMWLPPSTTPTLSTQGLNIASLFYPAPAGILGMNSSGAVRLTPPPTVGQNAAALIQAQAAQAIFESRIPKPPMIRWELPFGAGGFDVFSQSTGETGT